jgi:hypothetical protein
MSRFFEEQNGNENDSKIAGAQKLDRAAESRGGESVPRRTGEVCSSESVGD